MRNLRVGPLTRNSQEDEIEKRAKKWLNVVDLVSPVGKRA